MHERRWQRVAVATLVLFTALNAYSRWRPVDAQQSPNSSLPTQIAAIPATVRLPIGSTVIFSSGTGSLSVVYLATPGGPQPTGPTAGIWDASATYDGSLLTFELLSQRLSAVSVQPPDDQTCMALNGRLDAVRCSILPTPGRSPVTVFVLAEPGHVTRPCPDVPLTAGWNLIPGALARSINSNVGPLYTYQDGDSQYEAVTDVGAVSDTNGYWVLFDRPNLVFFAAALSFNECGPAQNRATPPVTRTLPPRQWVMVGNPFRGATITGADVVLTYDPVNGYQETSTLGLGQGAWAYSDAGSLLTITSTTAPSPPPLPSMNGILP